MWLIFIRPELIPSSVAGNEQVRTTCYPLVKTLVYRKVHPVPKGPGYPMNIFTIVLDELPLRSEYNLQFESDTNNTVNDQELISHFEARWLSG